MSRPIEGPLPLRLKLFQGVGAVAFGIKDNGFSVFLLLYYNQVLGMPAATVSLALAAALIIDAFVDPLIGNLCDRTYTRWGRRLPWLYAAALPLGVAWAFLWHPFGVATPSFWELLAIAVTVRLLLSCCEVPSLALVPEVTRDYVERTTLFRYRYLFGWIGGLSMMILAYTVLLPGKAMLEHEGYVAFGLIGAGLMFLSVLGSALGQHRYVAAYPPEKPGPFSFAVAFAEIREAFSERAFLIFAAGGVAAYVNQGMTFALSNYLYLFVWQFTETAFKLYALVLFASVLAVFFAIAPLHRRHGKPRTAWVAAVVSIVSWTIPYLCRLAGFWPEIGSWASSLLVYAFVFVSNATGVLVMISGASMVAEIVESFEERTGRRAEGSFYAGHWFVQKCATGLGLFFAGQMVSAAGLPENAEPQTVATPILDLLTVYYIVAGLVFGLIAAFFLARFPITRADHEARLRTLDQAARGDPDAGGMLP